MTSVCVLTMYHGPHAVLRPVTLLPLRSYAERHGYDLRVVDPVDGLPASWGKVAALREALDTYPVVAWLDADEAWGDLIGGHPSPIVIHNGYQAGDPANRARVLRRRRNQLAARSPA